MPIDDYLGNLKGHRYIKQKITPKREKYPPITSLTQIFLEGKQYKNYNYPDKLIWLDTEFRIQGDAKFIYYNHLNTSEGPVAHDRHFLNPFDFLISDCCLTLDNFLATPNSFGLPYSKSNYGNFLIKYHSPQRDGNVATYGGSDIIERRFNLNTEKEDRKSV